MVTGMRQAKELLNKVPVPSLILGAAGWLGAGVFFMFWLFDVGKGPLESARVGTAGEWFSGVVTGGTLA
jgi:hypothetical protein